jgi:peptidoglycan/LPS O-acetylase OafA/YrhL
VGVKANEAVETAAIKTIDQAGETRSSAIESLRALAALAVLEGHVFGTSQAYGAGAYATFFDRARLGGGFGVYLFLALTGYLLYRPFAQRDLGDGRALRLGRYGANRAFRILPLYYVVLVVYLLWIDHGGSATTWLRSLFFLENYFPQTLAHVDGVMWSLVVEVQFYLLLPVLALTIRLLAARSAKGTVLVLVAIGVIAELIRLTAVTFATTPDVRWQYSLPATFVYFVPGMLLAVIHTRWRAERRFLSSGPGTRSSVWVAASLPFWALVFWRYNLDVLLVPATYLVVGAVALPLRGGVTQRVLQWRPLAALGVASYSLYLWHFPIVNQVGAASWAPHGYLGLLAICVPLSCVVALVSYRLVEARSFGCAATGPRAPPRRVRQIAWSRRLCPRPRQREPSGVPPSCLARCSPDPDRRTPAETPPRGWTGRDLWVVVPLIGGAAALLA